MTTETCETCGATTVQYKHHLNRALVTGLYLLGDVGGGPLNIADLGLSRNVWDNFQKLRYWDLVEQCYAEDGTRQRGWWKITNLGWLFLAGKVGLPNRAWTYRGERIAFEGESVMVHQVNEGYQQLETWVEERRGNSR